MQTRGFVIQKQETVAAGATTSNLLQGTRLNPVVENGFISVWATASAATLTMNFQIQSDNIMSNAKISPTNAFPVKNEDWVLLEYPVSKADVVELVFISADAGGQTVDYVIEYRPVMMGRRGRR